MSEPASLPKTYGYPPEFKGLKLLKEQISLLVKQMKKLGYDSLDPSSALALAEQIESKSLPENAEGWAAILSPNIPPSYHSERELAAELLRLFNHDGVDLRFYQDDYMDDLRFRRDRLSETALRELQAEQQGDILLLPVQLGRRYAQYSDGEARCRYAKDEFALGLLAGASILVTHPERLGEYAHLGISFPGDMYDQDHDASFRRLCVLKMIQGRATVIHCRFTDQWMNDHGGMTGFTWS